MIPECGVLFAVQHLQQRRSGVAPLIHPQLVDLVQQHQRVAAAAALDRVDDPAGHSPHIGFSVSADLCLVVDAAQRQSGQLPIHGSRHRHGDGCLAYAGRADKAKHLPLQVRRQLTHRYILQNTLLDLFQAVVVPIQSTAHCLHAYLFFGPGLPGQLQADIQIVAQYTGLG